MELKRFEVPLLTNLMLWSLTDFFGLRLERVGFPIQQLKRENFTPSMYVQLGMSRPAVSGYISDILGQTKVLDSTVLLISTYFYGFKKDSALASLSLGGSRPRPPTYAARLRKAKLCHHVCQKRQVLWLQRGP